MRFHNSCLDTATSPTYMLLRSSNALIGVVVKTKNAAKGEIYAKWKRATNRKVGREGDEEEALMPSNFSGAAAGGRGRRGRWATAGSIEMDESAVTSGGKGPQKDKNGRLIRDELRDREQIRKAKTKVRVTLTVLIDAKAYDEWLIFAQAEI